MKNATVTRKQSNRFDVVEGTGLVIMKDSASGHELARFDMAALPEVIKLRILAQGGSTILQQRKSGESGAQAVETMKAHYANWLAGSWEMERKAARIVPSWVFPALSIKLAGVSAVTILAALEKKRQEASPDSWADFLKALEPYAKELREASESAEELTL